MSEDTTISFRGGPMNFSIDDKVIDTGSVSGTETFFIELELISNGSTNGLIFIGTFDLTCTNLNYPYPDSFGSMNTNNNKPGIRLTSTKQTFSTDQIYTFKITEQKGSLTPIS